MSFDLYDKTGGLTPDEIGGSIRNGLTPKSLAELSSYTGMSEGDTAYLSLGGRSGDFIWTLGDFSAEVAADTLQGVYVESDTVAATLGCWVRDFTGAASMLWWGAIPNEITVSGAVEASIDWLNEEDGRSVSVPEGVTRFGSDIRVLTDNAVIFGSSNECILRGESGAGLILGEAILDGSEKTGTKITNCQLKNFSVVTNASVTKDCVLLDFADRTKFRGFKVYQSVSNELVRITGVKCNWTQWVDFGDIEIAVNYRPVHILLPGTATENEEHYHFRNPIIYHSGAVNTIDGLRAANICIEKEDGRAAAIFEFSITGGHIGRFNGSQPHRDRDDVSFSGSVISYPSVSDDVSNLRLIAGTPIEVYGSDNNDGTLTVSSSSWDGSTVSITVNESLTTESVTDDVKISNKLMETSGILIINKASSDQRTIHNGKITGVLFEYPTEAIDTFSESIGDETSHLVTESCSFLGNNRAFLGTSMSKNNFDSIGNYYLQLREISRDARISFIGKNAQTEVDNILPNGIGNHRYWNKLSQASLDGVRLKQNGSVSVTTSDTSYIEVSHAISVQPNVFTLRSSSSNWMPVFNVQTITDSTFRIYFSTPPDSNRTIYWCAEFED